MVMNYFPVIAGLQVVPPKIGHFILLTSGALHHFWRDLKASVFLREYYRPLPAKILNTKQLSDKVQTALGRPSAELEFLNVF